MSPEIRQRQSRRVIFALCLVVAAAIGFGAVWADQQEQIMYDASADCRAVGFKVGTYAYRKCVNVAAKIAVEGPMRVGTWNRQ